NIAKRANALTQLGVTPLRLSYSGEIERPRQHEDAWTEPPATPDAIAAAFREHSDANAFACGGFVFRPGRRFVSRLRFAPMRKRDTEAQARSPQPAQDDAATRERANVERVLAAAGFPPREDFQ